MQSEQYLVGQIATQLNASLLSLSLSLHIYTYTYTYIHAHIQMYVLTVIVPSPYAMNTDDSSAPCWN